MNILNHIVVTCGLEPSSLDSLPGILSTTSQSLLLVFEFSVPAIEKLDKHSQMHRLFLRENEGGD